MGRVATDFAYLATIVAFILALKFLSHPATARRGNWIGAVGMLIAIGVTFAQKQIDSVWEILVGMAVGGVFGAVAARKVKMTAMPQMVALFNGVGGGAAALVSLAEFLNAFTGLAAAATGFELENNVLIVSGMLVGASGTLLTILMGRAMNRSIANVLFGAFGQLAAGPAAAAATNGGAVRSASADDVAVMLVYAHKVVVVPGYGMAVAQAQHDVRQLPDLLEARGVQGSDA